jgi:hypothetical protein
MGLSGLSVYVQYAKCDISIVRIPQDFSTWYPHRFLTVSPYQVGYVPICPIIPDIYIYTDTPLIQSYILLAKNLLNGEKLAAGTKDAHCIPKNTSELEW